MVAKSIIEIDVLDTSFEAFQARFLKYQEQVAAQPSAWKRVGASAKSTDNEFVKLGKSIAETVKGVQYAASRQEAFKIAAAGTAKTFVGMTKSSKALVGNLKEGAAVLLKWSGIIGLLSGVVGAGGLFGIARLAASASQNRRESQGLGVSGGELQAAQINYQKIFNVDELLGKINEARQDVTKRWAFSAAGIQSAQMEGKSNAEVLTMLAPLLKSTFERSGGTQQGAQAHGLLEFTDMSTLTRLKAISRSELDATEQSYRASLKQLDISDNVNLAWQQLEITFKNSGSVIEKMFKEKLVGLTGPLDHLSESFTKAVKVFLDSPKIEKWINGVADGLEDLSQYLVSDKFSKDVDSFLDGLDEFGGALINAARFMGKVFNIGSEKTLKASEYKRIDELKKINPALADATKYRLENPEASQEKADKFSAKSGWNLTRNGDIERKNIQDAITGKDGAKIKELLESLGISTATQSASGKIKPIQSQGNAIDGKLAKDQATPASGKLRSIPDGSKKERPKTIIDRDNPEPAAKNFLNSLSDSKKEKPTPLSDEDKELYARLEKKRGLPPGALQEVEWQESHRKLNSVGPMTKYGQAKGPFQFMDKTAIEYGVKDPFNRQDAATGAAWKLGDLMRHYNGDFKKALMAYNWGEGKLDKFGADNAPSETKKYAYDIPARMDESKKQDDDAPTKQSKSFIDKNKKKDIVKQIEDKPVIVDVKFSKDDKNETITKKKNDDETIVQVVKRFIGIDRSTDPVESDFKKPAMPNGYSKQLEIPINSAKDAPPSASARGSDARDYVQSLIGGLDRIESIAMRSQAAPQRGQATPQTIRIENATGGNAIVIGSQLA